MKFHFVMAAIISVTCKGIQPNRLFSSQKGLSAAGQVAHSWYKLPRVYTKQVLVSGKQLSIDEDLNHYLCTVMRLKQGMQFRSFNEKNGEFLCEISGMSKGRSPSTSSLVLESLRTPLTTSQLRDHASCTLFFAPIKKPKLRLLLEKAVELGVDHLVPVQTQNTQEPYTVDDSAWKKVVIESCEQCERLSIPTLHPSVSLIALQSYLESSSQTTTSSTLSNQPGQLLFPPPSSVLLCHERDLPSPSLTGGTSTRANIWEILSELRNQHQLSLTMKESNQEALTATATDADGEPHSTAPSIGLMIGPEGGFTESESRALSRHTAFTFVTLNQNILRSETAAISAMALFRAAFPA